MGGLSEEVRLQHWRVLKNVERRLRASPFAEVSKIGGSGAGSDERASQEKTAEQRLKNEFEEALRCWTAVEGVLHVRIQGSSAPSDAPLVCCLSASLECLERSLRDAREEIAEQFDALPSGDSCIPQGVAGGAAVGSASLRCNGFSRVVVSLFDCAEDAQQLPREEALLRRLSELLSLAASSPSACGERAALSLLHCLEVFLNLKPRALLGKGKEEGSVAESDCPCVISKKTFSSILEAAVTSKAPSVGAATRRILLRFLGSLLKNQNQVLSKETEHARLVRGSERSVQSLKSLCIALAKALKESQQRLLKARPQTQLQAQLELQRLLAILRRVLPRLLAHAERGLVGLAAPCVSLSSQKEGFLNLQKTAESLCLELVQVQPGGRATRVAAECLDTLSVILDKLLQFRLSRLESKGALDSPLSKSSQRASSLAIAAEILPNLLQRKVVEQAPFQVLSAWCAASASALAGVMRWASEAKEASRDAALKAASQAASQAVASKRTLVEVTLVAKETIEKCDTSQEGADAEGGGAMLEDEDETDEGARQLRVLMEKLSIESKHEKSTNKATRSRIEICDTLLSRFLNLLKLAAFRNDPTCAASAVLAAKRVVLQGLATGIPTFSAVAPFIEALLRFPPSSFRREALDLLTCLVESLEATAALQFLHCNLFPSLSHLTLKGGASLEAAPLFMAAFTSVYFQEFEPLMIIVRNALVDAEELYLERQRRKVSKKTSREGAAALESRWIELQTYKGSLETAFCAFVRVFKCERLLSVETVEGVLKSDAALSVQLELNLIPSADQTFNAFASSSNAWLLPLLRRGVCRDSLNFFQEKLLPCCRALEEASSRCLKEMRFEEAKDFHLVSRQIQALLPGFLSQPIDLPSVLTASNFSLVKMLVNQTSDSRFRETACASLTALAFTAPRSSDIKLLPTPLWLNASSATSEESRRLVDLRKALRKVSQSNFDAVARLQEEASSCAALCAPKEAALLPSILIDAACSAVNGKTLATAAPHVMAVLTARFLLLNKAERSDVETEFRDADARLFHSVSLSEKVKASQQILRAIQAFAPHCPETAMLSNIQNFAATFVSTAERAARGEEFGKEEMSFKECGSLVELTASLAAFVAPEAGRKVVEALLVLLRLCGKEEHRSTLKPNAAGFLSILERKTYGALKVVAETCCMQSLEADGGKGSTEKRPSWLTPQNLIQVWKAMAETRDGSSCGDSRQRVTCLKAVLGCLEASSEHLSKSDWDEVISQLLPKTTPEILLGLRSGNGRTREGAFEALNAISRLCISNEQALERLLTLIAAGLGGVSATLDRSSSSSSLHYSLMKTAALLALAHVFFAFSDELPHRILQELGSLGLLLLQDADRTVFKAAIGFARACIYAGDMDDVARWAPTILNSFGNPNAGKVRVKLRRLLLKLAKLLGEDVVEAAFPKAHMPLLRNVFRTERRQTVRQFLSRGRYAEASSEEEEDAPTESQTRDRKRRRGEKAFMEMLNEGQSEGDSDSDKEEAGVASRLSGLLEDSDSDAGRRRNRKRSASATSKGRSLCVLEDGAPLDFISGSSLTQVLQTRGAAKDRRTDDAPGGLFRTSRMAASRSKEKLEEDADGRIIVPFEEDSDEEGLGSADYGASEGPRKFHLGSISKAGAEQTRRNLQKTRLALKTQTEAGEAASELAGEKKKKKGLSLLVDKRRTMELKQRRNRRHAGHLVEKSADEFKASRAKGDALKKTGVAPYAFVRLNPKVINEKYKFQALKSLKSVVRIAKKRKDRRRSAARR